MKNRRWNYKEIKYLKEHFYEMSTEQIARKLNRTINAVKCKVHKLGLKDKRFYSEWISLYQFLNILGMSSGSDNSSRFAKKYPYVRKKKIIKCSIKVIYIDEFFNWLSQGNNKHLISLAKTEKGDLGVEPDWVDEKRRADKLAFQYNYNNEKKWTKAEEQHLIRLLNEYKYGYREISIMLKRTESAIKRRMLDLNIKARPLKADNHKKWTESEIAIVKDMYKKGYQSCIIAEHVPRSALAINGLLERHNYFLDTSEV